MAIRAKEVNGRLVFNTGRPAFDRNKYRAIRTEVDGIKFASKREAERYSGLKHLLRAGEISNLRLQVPYVIEVNGQKICMYIADFVYFDNDTNQEVVEDAKGMSTPVFRLKKKLLRAVLGIEIIEV